MAGVAAKAAALEAGCVGAQAYDGSSGARSRF